jgi:predicted amidohydrolase
MSDPSELRVAAVQLCSQAEVEPNLRAAREQVARAARLGAQLVVLPENFAYLGPEPGKRSLAERLDGSGPIVNALREMAREHGLTVVGGGFPEKSPDPDRPFNTCAVISSQGEVVAAYRKIHMFDVELPDGTSLCESEATASGQDVVTAALDGFTLGLSICYDLRFPELYRALVDKGADVMLVPAAFTAQTGKDHWHVLLRARAIESQSWVIAAAQWGKHPKGRASYGHALIVDPWGVVVADCSDRVDVAVASIDRDAIDSVRARLPSLKHRKLTT